MKGGGEGGDERKRGWEERGEGRRSYLICSKDVKCGIRDRFIRNEHIRTRINHACGL